MQGLLKGPADPHDLSHCLHCKAQRPVRSLELVEIPTGDLDDYIVKGRLKEGRGRFRDLILEFVKVIADRQLRRYLPLLQSLFHHKVPHLVFSKNQ